MYTNTYAFIKRLSDFIFKNGCCKLFKKLRSKIKGEPYVDSDIDETDQFNSEESDSIDIE